MGQIIVLNAENPPYPSKFNLSGFCPLGKFFRFLESLPLKKIFFEF